MPTSSGCSTRVVLDRRTIRWTPESWLRSTRVRLMWEKWPSKKSTTGPLSVRCFTASRNITSSHNSPSPSSHSCSLSTWHHQPHPVSIHCRGACLYRSRMVASGHQMLSHTHALWYSHTQTHQQCCGPIVSLSLPGLGLTKLHCISQFHYSSIVGLPDREHKEYGWYGVAPQLFWRSH